MKKINKGGYNVPPDQMSSAMASTSQFGKETAVTGVFSET